VIALLKATAHVLLDGVRRIVGTLQETDKAGEERLNRKIERLERDRVKLLHAHFEEAIPLSLLKKENQRARSCPASVLRLHRRLPSEPVRLIL
jgi:hypothetical protein